MTQHITAIGKFPTSRDWLIPRSRPTSLRPAMHQEGQKLLFIHCVWNAQEIQGTLPDGLTVDTSCDGADLGVVPLSFP